MPAERSTRPKASGLSTDDRPSRDEVQQRINSLYDAAETATGNYNATRAMSAGTRPRVRPRPAAARPSDPTLDAVAREWFDRARAQLGPTVPAILPPSRTPGRPAEPRPARPARRTDTEDTGRALEAPTRAIAELTAGPATTVITTPVAELTAGPLAALPPVPQAPPHTVLDLVPVPAVEPPRLALPAAPEPVLDPLTADLELLPYIVAPRTGSVAAAAPRPAQETTWQTEETPWQTDGMAWQTPETAWSTGETAWYAPPEPDWRPPQQEWLPQQPTAPAPGTAFTEAQPVSPIATAAVATTDFFAPPEAGTRSKTGTALAFARAQIGRPCLWGAAGPDAYDCSSLTQAAWKAAGVLLPRTAQEQSGAGALVPLTDIRPGDLIFFYDSVDHVGLYTGNGLMIHAPSPGTPIREESIFYAGPAAIRGAVRPA